MKRLLRGYLVTLAVLTSVAVLGLAWFASIADPCEYTPIYDRASPTDRYVAALYGADCGMGDHSKVVLLRDRSAVSLPFGTRPPGELVASDDDAPDEIRWEGETTLVIEYSGATAPTLHRAEWGGVRVETQRVERP